jgi:hypothetical protein
MSDRIYDVEITISKTVRVRVPVDDHAVVQPDEDPEAVAEEFALGGKVAWPDYVISVSTDHDVESVTEIPSSRAASEKARNP